MTNDAVLGKIFDLGYTYLASMGAIVEWRDGLDSHLKIFLLAQKGEVEEGAGDDDFLFEGGFWFEMVEPFCCLVEGEILFPVSNKVGH